MTTKDKVTRRKRTVRFHAVRKGDELLHEHKWWIVQADDIQPGETFNGTDPKTGEPLVQNVGQWNPEHSKGLHITRGRIGTVVVGPRNAVVTIFRSR